MPEITAETTLARAAQEVTAYEELVRDASGIEKGILFSELLFMASAVGTAGSRRVLESGRARGQSTWVLSRYLAGTPIISIEFDRDSPDAPMAEELLRDVENVDLRYGDSQIELPRMVEPGDAVLIDGPKGWKSVRLALRMLATGRPAVVFVHDCYRGLPRRRFLERHVPGAFFSDDLRFVETYGHLDEACWAKGRPDQGGGWRPYELHGVPQKSYGPTLACLPRLEGVSYRRLLSKARLAGYLARLQRYVRSRPRKRAADQGADG